MEDPGLQDPGSDIEIVQPMVANEFGDGDGEDFDKNDDVIITGPTVGAHVHLSKTAVTRIHPNELATDINQHDLLLLIKKFLYSQTHQPMEGQVPEASLPPFDDEITIYPSAVATFYSPSDISGVGGMRRERIRAIKSWRKGPPRYDCIFVETNPDALGMAGLDIARAYLFFSCRFDGVKYQCALVHWFSRVGQSADPGSGMWVVEPDVTDDGIPMTSVIHLDTVI